EEEDTKCLGLDRHYLARLEERELPLTNLNVEEAEYKGLIPHHKSIIRPKKFLIWVEKLISSPSRLSRAMRPEFLPPTRLRNSLCQPSSGSLPSFLVQLSSQHFPKNSIALEMSPGYPSVSPTAT